MKNFINQVFSLGLGAAVASKKQIEKIVNDLVTKGELSKAESKEWIDKLTERGVQARKELDDIVKTRIHQVLNELNLVTKDEVRELERRIEILERERKGD
jgi:polyhydroxyalkanoate synthesis regulator phasin